MTLEKWTAVDQYIGDLLVQSSPSLIQALEASTRAGLPAISVSPAQGKFLQQLVQILDARSILEVGTLGGYSTIWLASALPSGSRVVTLEVDAGHAAVASANIAHAGLSDRVEVRIGAALDTLPRVAADGLGPFDMSFIDADKPNIPEYFEWALKLSRRGSVIIVDNVVREGEIVDADSDDASVKGVRRLNEMLAVEPLVSATVIQTVGSKGYDGFAMILVTGDP